MTGARLPHAWIRRCSNSSALDLEPVDVSYVDQFTKNDVQRRQFSTLDLAGYDKFTLIVSPSAAWEPKFREIQELLKRAGARIELWVVDKDFEFVDKEQRALFEEKGGLAHGGGFIVRPDQHLLGLQGPNTTAQDIASQILCHLGQEKRMLL